MKRTFAIIAGLVFFGQAALAANVFVRDVQASNLQQDQSIEVTEAVKRAVSNMPEHKLVQSEEQADFVLQPSVVRRGDEQVLRIEKTKDGNVLAMSEETISSVNNSQDGAFGVTETAMNDDQYVSGDDSMSAMSAPGNRDIASSPSSQPRTGTYGANNQSGKSGASTEESRQQSLSGSSGQQSSRAPASTQSGQSGTMGADNTSAAAGESRGASPRFANPNRLGYFSIGAGPAFGVGLETDNIMYNINGGYNIDITENLTGKGFVDLNLSTGADSGRLINVGIGANVYIPQAQMAGARPYLTGDVGYGFARTDDDQTKDAIAAGAGAGFQFSAAQLNMDVSLHYSILTAQINDDNPSVLGLRVAVNF